MRCRVTAVLEMSSASVLVTRTAPRSWSGLSGMIVLASLLVGSGASAQTAGDASRTPSGNLVRNGPFQVAYSEWRRLPQSEVNCVDQWYRAQGSNLGSQIQRGIGPSSSTVAKVRAECRGQARAPGNPVSANTGSQSLASASNAADRRQRIKRQRTSFI